MSETLVLHHESDAGMDTAGWIRENDVREVECLIPDMNGVLRGKILPAEKFLKAIDGGALYMPTSALLVCADGRIIPDRSTKVLPMAIRTCCWCRTSIRSAFRRTAGRSALSSLRMRATLPTGRGAPCLGRCSKSVLSLYAEKGWRAVVAPELEFYLTAPNPDPREPVTAPSPRTAAGRGRSTPTTWRRWNSSIR